MFILELTLRGWGNCERDKRKTLTKNDVVVQLLTSLIHQKTFSFCSGIYSVVNDLNKNMTVVVILVSMYKGRVSS